MSSGKIENYKLSQEIWENLRREHKKTHEKWVADRLKAVFLLGSGWSVGDVAEVLMVDENTVRVYFQKWKSGGIDALKQRLLRGRATKLTDAQKVELGKWLDENLCQKVAEIQRHILKMYHVFFTRSGMCSFLNRLGFVYKKPKHVPGKADPEKQKEFVTKYRKLLKKCCGKRRFLYPMHGKISFLRHFVFVKNTCAFSVVENTNILR
ncbi:MAG: winged helix-turn-helix domain-containing protein [Planctomycetia bacterium]|nr:winged helix-turn-helix domain-containing protein [Planctomycetia bacterium]